MLLLGAGGDLGRLFIGEIWNHRNMVVFKNE